MYSSTYEHLAIRENMGQIVMVYGIWHAYKNVCLHLHRAFFPVWVYLDRGLCNTGEEIPAVQKLAYVERLIAGLWVAGTDLLPAIDSEINRMMAGLGGVRTRSQNDTRVVFDAAQHSPSPEVQKYLWTAHNMEVVYSMLTERYSLQRVSCNRLNS